MRTRIHAFRRPSPALRPLPHRGLPLRGLLRRALSLPVLALLTGAILAGTTGPAAADSPSPGSSTEAEAGPTEAGTSFRTAAAFKPGQRATANASTGDYLYWVFPVDAGQRATVKATVTLPDTAARQGSSTWQIDVYDGLRRRQACMYGRQNSTAAPQTGSVALSCTLRTVRAWAEPWSNDPLPGSYYIRLTVTDLAESDRGLPVQAAVEATTVDTGGSSAVDGSLAAPLVPGTTAGQKPDDSSDSDSGSDSEPASSAAAASEPEGGWSSGWWTDRWLWTAAGGALATLAGFAGYRLAGGRRR